MGFSLDKYIHLLGVKSVTELMIFIGIMWGVIFVLFLLLLYPLAELGLLNAQQFALLVALAVLLSFVLGFASILIPAKIKQENIDKNFPVFLAFLGSMTTAKTNYDEFFKTLASTTEYGEISKEMKRLYHLAKDWKLGYAKACKVVADTTPSKVFSNFLTRLSQVVEYGEDFSFFFKNQYADIMRDLKTAYQEAVFRITTIAELFSALFVSAAFLIAFIMLMPIFFPIDTTTIAIGSFLGVLALDVLLVTLARTSVPTDKFANDFPDTAEEHKKAVIATLIGIILAVLFFLVSFILGLPAILQVAFTALPLIVPAFLTWTAERIIRKREESYIPFIRTLGDLTAIREGAITPVLRRLRRHIYPGLNEAIERLYKRLAVTRQVFKAMELFSKELGSALISKFNELFVKALYAGANPKEVGAIIGDQMHAILDMRKLRLQTAGAARGTLYGSYLGVALGVFLAVKSMAHMFAMFSNVLASMGEVVSYFAFFNFQVNLFPLIDVLVYIFAFEAIVLAIVIKIMDGGLMSDAVRHYIILILGLVVVYFITDWALAFILPPIEEATTFSVPGT